MESRHRHANARVEPIRCPLTGAKGAHARGVERANAVTYGVDTRIRFADRTYEIAANLGLTHIDGEPAAIARAVAAGRSGNPPARVVGSALRTSPEAAVFANGCAIRYLDANDQYQGKLFSGHPSDVLSAALAEDREFRERFEREAHKFPSVQLKRGDDGARMAFAGGELTRPISPKLSDLEDRKAWMDKNGIHHQLVGGWVDSFGYELPGAEGAACNTGCQPWCKPWKHRRRGQCAETPRVPQARSRCRCPVRESAAGSPRR